MLFNSFEFLLFLPIIFLLYWTFCKTRFQQNLLVVIASYIFYGWWDWRFLVLIIFTSLTSFCSGIAIFRFRKNRKKQTCANVFNIIINLFVLGVFKYYNFFAESLQTLFRSIGYQIDFVTLNIILPVGISFYTFQALSYGIDVYKGKVKPTNDIIQFFAYICFFPQLVAGPIERAVNLIPQFNQERKYNHEYVVDGLRQMLWGFFKKVVVADLCAYYVNHYWNDFGALSGLMLIQVSILFSFQIYCDFSGYSDIAIGCARLFGIDLMRNFNVPYFSRNIAEFWRKWHMSLMTWFRDYVYIPLGGNRCSKWKASLNTFIVFLSVVYGTEQTGLLLYGGGIMHFCYLLVISSVVTRNILIMLRRVIVCHLYQNWEKSF